MQGLESLSQFQKFVSTLGGLGRFEDTYMIHAAEGETVVPMEVLDRNPVLKKRLFKSMVDMGIDPGRYIVGNDLNSLNPLTGQPEFFFKKLVKRLKKAAGDISGYAAPIVGSMYGPAAGAAVGAGLGAFKRENPGDPSQWAQMGMLGGASGLAANLAGGAKGMDILTGRGIQGAGGLGQFLKGRTPGAIGDPGTQGFLGSAGQYGGGRIGDFFDKGKRIFKSVEDGDTDSEDDGVFGGLNWKQLAAMWGLGTAGLGFLIDKTSSDEDVRIDRNLINQAKQVDDMFFQPGAAEIDYGYEIPIRAQGGIIGYDEGGDVEGKKGIISRIWNKMFGTEDASALGTGLIDEAARKMAEKRLKEMEYFRDELDIPVDIEEYKKLLDKLGLSKSHGGVMDLQGGGFSQGPGTGTSDSIPAMLSDGEFVMTADAVRGAGGGNRREGARKMYETMDRLEARV